MECRKRYLQVVLGEGTEVTVNNIKRDLNEWGVISYIFKIFDWGKPKW
jgi:hypothetical protein